MKALSGIMGKMWDADPNKPIFSLLAKTWSMIRDQIGKDAAPLRKFLRIVCPSFGLCPPSKYLATFGWSVGMNSDGSPSLLRFYEPERESLVAGSVDGRSCEDIIKYVQLQAFALEYKSPPTSSTTFHVQLGQKPRNSGEVIEVMHYEREVARNKRRARRQQRREAMYKNPQPWMAESVGEDVFFQEQQAYLKAVEEQNSAPPPVAPAEEIEEVEEESTTSEAPVRIFSWDQESSLRDWMSGVIMNESLENIDFTTSAETEVAAGPSTETQIVADPTIFYDDAGPTTFYDGAGPISFYDGADLNTFYDEAGPSTFYDDAGSNAFRDGADDDVTLPNNYSDSF
jgi:hypothetical protein